MSIHKKTLLNSALLLLFNLGIAFTIQWVLSLEGIYRMAVLLSPFIIHLILSVFIKRKESWLFGAVCATLFSLIVFIITFATVV